MATGTGYDELITGDACSEVRFVRDYVQIVFWPLTLSVYSPIQVQLTGRGSLNRTDVGFFDAICGLIGQRIVDTARIEKTQMSLQFEDGTVLHFSLRPSDVTGPEIAQLSDDKGFLMVERYGE